MPNLTALSAFEIGQRARSGESISALSRQFGVSRTHVYRLRNGADNTRRQEREERAQRRRAQRLAAVTRLRQGEPIEVVAGDLGVKPATIYSWSATTSTHERFQFELQNEWLTVRAACGMLNCDKSSLCERLRAGRIPGAFRLDDHPNSPWLIPRSAIEAEAKAKT